MTKRRDITLGEMQDECRKHEHGGSLNCTKCDPIIKSICDEMDVKALCFIDLADPPRFNEAQMALLKGLYAVGITKLQIGETGILTVDARKSDGTCEARFSSELIGISKEHYETLDLAELIGKENE